VVGIAWLVMGRPWPTSFAGPVGIAVLVLFAIAYFARGTGISVGADVFGVQTRNQVDELSNDFAGTRGGWWSRRVPSLSSTAAAITLVGCAAAVYAIIEARGV
jgi:hypothetical protein